RLTVWVPGHVRSISPFVQAVMAGGRAKAFAAGKEFEIEMGLGEALAKAILHRGGDDASQGVEGSGFPSQSRAGATLRCGPRTWLRSGLDPEPCRGRERVFNPRARHLPDHAADGRGMVRAWGQRDPHAEVVRSSLPTCADESLRSAADLVPVQGTDLAFDVPL